MRAVALGAGGRLEVTDRPEPVADPGHVVVAVERCGICGSDLHLRDSGLLPVGAVLGHEFAGPVVAVGDGVTGLAEGQRVAVLPAGRCGRCELCRAGRGNLCPTQATTVLGLGINDGAYAERVRVPAPSCHPLPEAMSPEQGALVEPYAVALRAVGRGLAGADSQGAPADVAGVGAAVVGGGPIGLMCVAALRRAGVEAVVVAEPRERRAGVARAMGATVVASAGRIVHALGRPPDVVFEAAGVPATPPAALEAVRPGGRVVLLGVPAPGQTAAMPALLWVVKEVDVVPSIAYTDEEFAAAVDAVAAGAVDPSLLVSGLRALEEADAAFAELAAEDAPVKLMLTPSS